MEHFRNLWISLMCLSGKKPMESVCEDKAKLGRSYWCEDRHQPDICILDGQNHGNSWLFISICCCTQPMVLDSVLLDRHQVTCCIFFQGKKTSFTVYINNAHVPCFIWILIHDAKLSHSCVPCKHPFKEPRVWHYKVVVFLNLATERRGFSLCVPQI